MSVHIVHDNKLWLQPFSDALAKRGIPFHEVDLSKGGTFDLSNLANQFEDVWYMRVSPSSHTRGARYSMEAAILLSAQLEASGATVVNGSSALGLEMSKAKQLFTLQMARIASPHKVAVLGKTHLVDAINAWSHGTPLLLKHGRCGSGTGVCIPDMSGGVHRFASKEEALRHVNSSDYEESVDGITLIEQCIKSSEDFVRRLEFVGGKYLYAVKVDAASVDPTSRTPLPEGSVTVDSVFMHPIIGKLERMLAQVKVDICAVEVIMDEKGEAFVIDMNCCNTNYNIVAEKTADIRCGGCGAVAAFLEQCVIKAKERTREVKLEEEQAAKRARLSSADGGSSDAVNEIAPAWTGAFINVLPDVSKSTLSCSYH